jgi:poly-beta-1,6-N-acetyl-D-glucosamine synthase
METKTERSETILQLKRKLYIPVIWKFWISHMIALVWLALSVYVSIPWVKELGELVSLPISLLIITGIAFIPGYLNAFMVASLIVDRQPIFKVLDPKEPVTILIACHNEEKTIEWTLTKIAGQDFSGHIKIIVIDNHSTD